MIYFIVRLLASALCGALIAVLVTFMGWPKDGSLALLLGIAVGCAIFWYVQER